MAAFDYVAASAQGKSGDASDAGVEDHDAGNLVQFRAMGDGVGMRSDHAFFFSREKDEADGAPRTHAGSLDGAQSIDHQRGIAAVVERAGAQVP